MFSRQIQRFLESAMGALQTRLSLLEAADERRERVLLEEQLRRAQRMEALGLLASGMAHDFNNLLMAIMGNVEFALESVPKDSVSAEDLNEALDAGHRAADLTHRLLAMGRSKPASRSDHDLLEIVDGIGKLLRRLIGEAIIVDVLPADASLTVNVDRGEIEQILLNLATNSRDAMPEGGHLRISLAVERAETVPEGCEENLGKDHAVLSVHDSGTGMDEETIARICDPFFTTKPPGLGTGLGLSMASTLVSASGGWMEINSALGEGTDVRIHLPLSTETTPESPVRKRTPRPQGAGECVLLVEDDEGVGMVVARTLERNGYEVLAAKHGREAIDLLANEHCDLVITDLVMPEMGGEELAALLRVRFPDLPILVCSGYLSDEAMQFAIPEPVGWLAKPFSPLELCEKVHALLRGGGGAS